MELTSISMSYEDREVLQDIYLSIEPQSIFGLVGPNGSGKSTLLKLMAGILIPKSGTITWQEQPLFDNPVVKQRLCYVGDEPFFYHQATLEKMIEQYQLAYHRFEPAVVYRLIKEFDLPLHQRMRSFSKGMVRQAMIALALAARPQILLLDEIFDGLDPMVRKKVKSELTQLVCDHDCEVVLSSHNLRELEHLCDHYGLIDQGKLITTGDLNEKESSLIKLQCAFEKAPDENAFDDLEVVDIKGVSRMLTLVIRGNEDSIKEQLSSLSPVMIERLPLHLEEWFLYELQARGIKYDTSF